MPRKPSKFASRVPHSWTLLSAKAITPDGRYVVGDAGNGTTTLGYRLFCG